MEKFFSRKKNWPIPLETIYAPRERGDENPIYFVPFGFILLLFIRCIWSKIEATAKIFNEIESNGTDKKRNEI